MIGSDSIGADERSQATVSGRLIIPTAVGCLEHGRGDLESTARSEDLAPCAGPLARQVDAHAPGGDRLTNLPSDQRQVACHNADDGEAVDARTDALIDEAMDGCHGLSCFLLFGLRASFMSTAARASALGMAWAYQRWVVEGSR